MNFTNTFDFLRAFWPGPRSPVQRPQARIVVVVEGVHDIEFLSRISRILHSEDPRLPDLGMMEQAGHLLFLPTGGGDVRAWARRLAVLAVPQVYVFDRELPPATETRLLAAAMANRRSNCRAFVTTKRALENYLDPRALLEAQGINLTFDDHDDVPDLVARHCCATDPARPAWNTLSPRARKRFLERAKKWLNREAVERMTPQRLAERDSQGEVGAWLQVISRLVGRAD
jgi:hypothetical protein